MAIRDFAANRSFSGNGLWQWDEKQKASASRGVVLGRRVRAAVGVAIPTTANSINHIHYPTRADHQACRGTYLGAINVVHRSLVRCAVLGPCGGLREDEHGIAVTVPTKNPNRFEVEPQPEPEQATWAKLSVTVERSDGGIVDAEIIRPRSWILRNGICVGRMLPFNLPELEVSGLALVTAIEDCPPIAGGEGSVVTARFVTREVHVVASVDVLGADGTVETITGTTIHPVWSVDRQKWVPLAELAEGETLQGLDGLAVVLGVSLSRVTQPVYNIEVHGEHVYQVGELGLVVHNVHDCVGWVRSSLVQGERVLLKGRGRELLSIPGYSEKVFHHAFIKNEDLIYDTVFTSGTSFHGWIKKVALDNNKSVDEILAMMGQLPEMFK